MLLEAIDRENEQKQQQMQQAQSGQSPTAGSVPNGRAQQNRKSGVKRRTERKRFVNPNAVPDNE